MLGHAYCSARYARGRDSARGDRGRDRNARAEIGRGSRAHQRIAAKVKEALGLPAYAVAAQFPGRAKDKIHTHGAAMVAFANPKDEDDAGYVLLDPGFNVSAPVVVTAKVPAPVRAFLYSHEGTESGADVVSQNKEKEEVVRFPADRTPNNPEAISKMALLTYDAFSIVNRAGNARRFMQLDLKKDAFKLAFADAKAKKTVTLTISTANLEEAKVNISKAITEEVATTFGYKDAATLLESVFKVLDSKRDILALQNSKITD